MPEDIYITGSVVVSDHRIFKNSALLFENDTVDLPGFLISAYRYSAINYPKFYKMDNLAKLGWLATEVLLENTFEKEKYKLEEVGIFFSNASSSLDADLRYFESTKDIASPALFVYTLPNIVIGEICIKHKFKGESAFFIFETFNAEFMEKYVSNLFNSNILQAGICGWVELIGQEYRAVLFLVEKEINIPQNALNTATAFTIENLNKIYHSKNG